MNENTNIQNTVTTCPKGKLSPFVSLHQQKLNNKHKYNFTKEQVFTLPKRVNSGSVYKRHKIRESEWFVKVKANKKIVQLLKENKLWLNCLKSGHHNDECRWAECEEFSKLIHFSTRVHIRINCKMADDANTSDSKDYKVDYSVESLNQIEKPVNQSIQIKSRSKHNKYKENGKTPIVFCIGDKLSDYFVNSKLIIILQNHNSDSKGEPKFGVNLDISEISELLRVVLKLIQREKFSVYIRQWSEQTYINIKGGCSSFVQFLDVFKLISVGNSNLSFSEKHPIVLIKNNNTVSLNIRENHVLWCISEAQSRLKAVRAKTWPINGKNAIKLIIHKCVLCRGKSYLKGNLLRNSVISRQSFSNVELDYCGSFYIKTKRLLSWEKIKVCVYLLVRLTLYAEPIKGLITDVTKSIKGHFYKTMFQLFVAYNELLRDTTELESIFRSYYPLSNDLNNNLTPTLFLIGDTFASVPQVKLTPSPVNRLSEWECIQLFRHYFRKRRHKENLNQLVTRTKLQQKSAEKGKLGTLVVSREDNVRPVYWSRDRVLNGFLEDYERVRVRKVKTKSDVLNVQC
ncbi:uncharacterized protein LOC112906760 [Agrilus planipennis]|uniref:Uncharacterized protein LOC112906760 n=1 Tax=Agrilus planipennis TaxID=224129 RepID=A0A7F5RMX0_AGRPL|nr:uncharacterized protein LOC112906760 [Agrilus planipennis]